MLQTAYLYLRSSGAYFDLALKTTWDIKKKKYIMQMHCASFGSMFSLPHSWRRNQYKKEEDDNWWQATVFSFHSGSTDRAARLAEGLTTDLLLSSKRITLTINII